MLKIRVIAALFFAPALLGLVWLGGWPLKLTCLLIAILMLSEFLRLSLGPKKYYLKTWGFILGGATALQLLHITPQWPFEWLFTLGILLLMSAIVINPQKLSEAIVNIALVFFGIGYSVGLITYLAKLRDLTHGVTWALMALFCTWAADTGAYFVGRFLGRHKLYPKVSPGKTVEGAFGGCLGAVVVAFLIPHLLGLDLLAVHSIVIGFLAAGFGLIGDLAESVLKRSVGSKDSGRIIPGHGGVLDRFDGVMFVSPVLYLYCLIFIGN